MIPRPGKLSYLIVCAVAALGLGVGTAASVQASPSAGTAAQTVACAAGTNVNTADGPVCGIVDNGVDEWLGIPYAAPPLGALRWQAPQPPTPWASTLQA